MHPPKAPELPRKAKADLGDLQERAFKLLLDTPPRARAAGFVETLKRILQVRCVEASAESTHTDMRLAVLAFDLSAFSRASLPMTMNTHTHWKRVEDGG